MLIIFYRTFFLYFFITFILRFTGKRQLGEMSPSELVTAFLISNIAACPVENIEKSLLTGILPIAVIASLEVIMSYLNLKFPCLRHIFAGRPRKIIKDGKPDEKMMEALRISIDDLEAELRANGIFNIADVQEAVVETNGSLSVLQKFSARAVNNLGAGIKDNEKRSLIVIKDGRVSKENLNEINKSEALLTEKLSEINADKGDIFLMTMDENGKISYCRKEK